MLKEKNAEIYPSRPILGLPALGVPDLPSGLAVTLQRLADLSDDEPEEGFPNPTAYASRLAVSLLTDAQHYLLSPFPPATVSVEEHGGVFVYWIKSSCTVQLTVPAEGGKLFYLRVRRGAATQVYQDPDGRQLADSLLAFQEEN